MASFTFPFYFLFFLLPLSVVFAQTRRNLTVGDSITSDINSSSWLSPSGDFAFGFKKLETSNDQYLLSIWYDKIPEKTIVWNANGDSPAPSGSKVELSETRGLVLTDPQGKEIWKSQSIIGGGVASAAMTDSGNLVIQDNRFNRLWESFKYPEDTILPSQILEKGVEVSSRQSETNFSKGRFIFLLQNDGNLVLATINLPSSHANEPYYASGTSGESNPGKELVFNESGYLNILRENNQLLTLTQGVIASTRDSYHRATLNPDGVFTQYYYPKNGGNRWIPFWSKPDDICQSNRVSAGSGTCGFNSVCRLNSENRPFCECPGGYSLLDPNDRFGSCMPNYTQICGEMEEGRVEHLYDFEELVNTDWPTSDYALLQPFTEEQCRQSCLQDCMCAVAIFRSGDMCWKKKLPLSNGRVDPKLDGKALLKVRTGEVDPRIPYVPKPAEPEKQRKDRGDLILAGSVLVGCSLFANILLVTAVCLGFFLIYKKKTRAICGQEGIVETNLRCFTYQELEEATNVFKEEAGRGAFGIVYKGCLQNQVSRTVVAVKKLHSAMLQDGLKEFKTEVNVIGKTHHKNLVRLIGFCDEGDQHLLVYEFLSNGTLSSFLFGDLKPSWNKRIQIAFGIARGLLYLHEECSTQIIHCDIKPQNILLDEYYNAKISDFGLAKLLLLGQSHTHTAIRGTRGYVAPEWFRNLPVTVKVDVYSFGVMLLEIVCCRRSVDSEESLEEGAILTDWAYNCFCEGTFDKLVGFDMEAIDDKDRLERFVMVAIWCIQEDPSLRPNMRQVTQMLEGIVEVPVPPCPFPYNFTTEMSLPSLQTQLM